MTSFGRFIFCLAAAGACLSWGGILGGLTSRMHEFQLGNGMRFVVLERHHYPQVSAWMFVLAGEMDEGEGQRGVAGLMDNVFLMGTEITGSRSPASEKAALAVVERAMDRLDAEKKRSSDEFSLGRETAETEVKIALDQARQWESDTFRQMSAANGMSRVRVDTRMDSTGFGWTMPSERAEVWFKLLGEWLGKPSFRGFYRVRDAEARKENPAAASGGSDVDWMAMFRREAFPDSPYGRPSGQLGSLRARGVEQYFRERYRASRMAVALVGDITPGQARQWAERYFGSLPAEQEMEARPAARVKTGAYRENMNAMLSAVGYRRPPHGHVDDLYFDLLTSLLAGGTTPSYLTEMKVERQVAQNTLVAGNYPGDRLESLFVLAAAPAPGRTTGQVEAATIEIAEKFSKEPLEAGRLAAAVNRIQVEFLLALQSNEAASVRLARAVGMGGTVKGIEQEFDRLQSVSPAEFQKFAQQYLKPENRFVFALGPNAMEKAPGEGGQQ